MKKIPHSPLLLDNIKSIPHLVDSVAFGLKHANRHAISGHEALHLFEGGDQTAHLATAWNTQHAHKHICEALEHTGKVKDHIAFHKDLGSVVDQGCLTALSAVAATVERSTHQAERLAEHQLALLASPAGSRKNMGDLNSHFSSILNLLLSSREHVREMVRHILMDPLMAVEFKLLSAANPMPDPRAQESDKMSVYDI